MHILLSHYEYDQTFDPKVVIGHCDLLYGSMFLPYILTVIWYMTRFFKNMSVHDQDFYPIVVICLWPNSMVNQRFRLIASRLRVIRVTSRVGLNG